MNYDHKKELCGNDARKLVEKCVDMNYSGPASVVLKNLHEVQQYATSHHIDDYSCLLFKQKIDNLFKSIYEEFPDFSPGTKLHVLQMHVNDFINTNKCWGSHGEQSTEAIHHLFSQFCSRAIGDDVKKFIYASENIIMQNKKFLH